MSSSSASNPNLERCLAAADALRKPCATMTLGGPPESSTGSYLAGHPYLPPGAEWPSDQHGDPMAFVCQVNFADVPPGTDLPRSGLLQWFVSGGELHGLTFGDAQGRPGFVVRHYDTDTLAGSTAEPDAPTPPVRYHPLGLGSATAVTFEVMRDLPGWWDLPAEVRADPMWAELAVANGEAADDAEFVYDERVRVEILGSKLGGYALFTQEDPRGDRRTPAERLLVQLDSEQTGGWGDAGVAHLFADPTAIAAGDLSGVTYHWDCL